MFDVYSVTNLRYARKKRNTIEHEWSKEFFMIKHFQTFPIVYDLRSMMKGKVFKFNHGVL